jgi:hypothetical protein
LLRKFSVMKVLALTRKESVPNFDTMTQIYIGARVTLSTLSVSWLSACLSQGNDALLGGGGGGF